MKAPNLKKKSSDSSEKSLSKEMEDVFFEALDIVGGMLGDLSCRPTTLSPARIAQLMRIRASLSACVAHAMVDLNNGTKKNMMPSSKPSFRRNGLHFGSVAKWILGGPSVQVPTTGSLKSPLSDKNSPNSSKNGRKHRMG